MAIKKKVEDAINKQINAELYSSYLYLSMAAYFEKMNLKGFANWMRVQAQEENFHAMKFYDHIVGRGGQITLTSIKGPETDWKSPLAVFEETYKHEQLVTSLINKIMDLAIAESDHATISLLKWFVDEQVEEEASADEILQKLKLVKDDGHALLMLDNELAQRVFTPPAANPEGA